MVSKIGLLDYTVHTVHEPYKDCISQFFSQPFSNTHIVLSETEISVPDNISEGTSVVSTSADWSQSTAVTSLDIYCSLFSAATHTLLLIYCGL